MNRLLEAGAAMEKRDKVRHVAAVKPGNGDEDTG